MYKDNPEDNKLKVYLTAPYGDIPAGRIITVNEGVYDTLIQLGKGKPAEYIQAETDYTKDEKIKLYEDMLQEKEKQMNELLIGESILSSQIEQLKNENEELKQKIDVLESYLKDRRRKPNIRNTMIKDEQVTKK